MAVAPPLHEFVVTEVRPVIGARRRYRVARHFHGAFEGHRHGTKRVLNGADRSVGLHHVLPVFVMMLIPTFMVNPPATTSFDHTAKPHGGGVTVKIFDGFGELDR